MSKEILLAKSNFKRKKSATITIGLLILLSTLLLGLSLLLMLDVYPNTERYAKKLDAGDGIAILYKDINGLDDEFFSNILKDNTEDYEVRHILSYTDTSIPFSEGSLTTRVLINDSSAFNKKMDKTMIEMEDESISGNYIYLPYQFYANGTNKIGDTYKLNLNGLPYEYVVKGYIINTSYGCSNMGMFEFIVNDASYNELCSNDPDYKALTVTYKLNGNITAGKLNLLLADSAAKVNNKTLYYGAETEHVISTRGFMANILALSFLVVTGISTLVIVLMIFNSISNYIKENMKQIGVLKAMGYTSSDIIKSLIYQFMILTLIATIIGSLLSYALIPVFSSVTKIQQGLPYNVSFNWVATIIPVLAIALITFLSLLIATRKINKINPIVALRVGLDNHNFKKNRIALDKSKFNLNISLALKTLFNNLKQNIVTFIVVGLLTFTCGNGLLMYENFNRNPKTSLLTFEICSGVVAVDSETKADVRNYLESRNDVKNVRNIINLNIIYGDMDDSLMAFVIDDPEKLVNTDVCIDGRLAKYDNEICISAKFARNNDINIGDEVEFSFAGNKVKYLVSGFVQTTNNNGKEAFMTFDAANKFTDLSEINGYYWFDSTEEATQGVLDDVTNIYENHIITTMNFYTIMEGALSTFKAIALIMLVMVCVVSAIVILLVLYLFIKTLLHNKRIEYGIMKSMGYTSKNLMLQTTFSFMPSIILSVIIFSVVSYFTQNPFMNLIMINFGLVKCTFDIPVAGLFIIGIGLILLSFGLAIFESRRIKSIEPYKLLIEE